MDRSNIKTYMFHGGWARPPLLLPQLLPREQLSLGHHEWTSHIDRDIREFHTGSSWVTSTNLNPTFIGTSAIASFLTLQVFFFDCSMNSLLPFKMAI